MKLRHPAALVLVGWYLMVPPFLKDQSGALTQSDASAPLKKWEVLESFNSAAACEEEKARKPSQESKAIKQIGQGAGAPLPVNVANAHVLRFHEALCIPSDDPRLRK